MKKLVSYFSLLVLLGSCQIQPEENIAPLEIQPSTNHANLREGNKDLEPIKDDEDNVMTATLVARREDSPEVLKEHIFSQLSKEDKQDISEKEIAIRNDEIETVIRHYQQVFKENGECQAIFRDDISKVEFGYVKEFPKEQTTLKAILCADKECNLNGVVIEIRKSINCDTCRGGALSEWLRAILCF